MRVRVALLPLLAACVQAADLDCAACHPKEARQYDSTPMARALLRPAHTEILAKPAVLTFQEGAYRYKIAGSTYEVTDGNKTIAAPILWSFGAGVAGQTYVYEYEGALYESRVSYYDRIRGLDLTIGAAGSKPSTLEMAAGRKMHGQDVAECFGCHSTGTTPRFDMAGMTPGVQCGACHNNVVEHQRAPAKVMPARLRTSTSEQLNELCGRCHRTWEQITINGPKGVANVRFQPYRLTNSQCYDAEDRRISCVACHDPHSTLERRAEFYDPKCTACHSAGSGSAAAARIAILPLALRSEPCGSSSVADRCALRISATKLPRRSSGAPFAASTSSAPRSSESSLPSSNVSAACVEKSVFTREPTGTRAPCASV